MLFPCRVLLLHDRNQGRSDGHRRLLQNSGSSPQLSAKSKSHTEKKHFPHLSKSYEGKLSPRNQAHGPTSTRSAPAKHPRHHRSVKQPLFKPSAELPACTWPCCRARSGGGEQLGAGVAASGPFPNMHKAVPDQSGRQSHGIPIR